MDWMLYCRYALELALLYPAAAVCYLPVRERLKVRRDALLVAGGVSLAGFILLGALMCVELNLPSNALLLPTLAVAFGCYYRLVDCPLDRKLFAFFMATAMMAICSLTNAVLTVRLADAQQVDTLAESALCLALAGLMVALYARRMAPELKWLIDECDDERLWRAAWAYPAGVTVLYVLLMSATPALPANGARLAGLLATLGLSAVVLTLAWLFLKYAREATLNARLARENRLLTAESRRYIELRAYMDETSHLRHDFRQHLRVINGLAEAGRLDSLREYLRQYAGALSEERLTLCANAAVDAIAGHYEMCAHRQGVATEWKLDLPARLSLPEAELCVMLGELLERALTACAARPAGQRRLCAICRMLSPAMLGLVVEYSCADGPDAPVKSESVDAVERLVSRYNGQFVVETEGDLRRVNVLLNL